MKLEKKEKTTQLDHFSSYFILTIYLKTIFFYYFISKIKRIYPHPSPSYLTDKTRYSSLYYLVVLHFTGLWRI